MFNFTPPRTRPPGLLTLAALVAALIVPASAQAERLTVCGSGCNQKTISAAVAAAAPGDSIEVRAGTFRESVTIDTPRLELRGAKGGTDARGRRNVGETVVTGPDGGFLLGSNADDVTIDGFRISGGTRSTSGTAKGTGIVTSPGVAGARIINNVITSNVRGIRLNGDTAGTPTQTLVSRNQIARNNRSAPADQPLSGVGILSDLGISNVEISENRFTGHRRNTIVFGTRDAPVSQGVDILANDLSDESGIALSRIRSLSIVGNESLAPAKTGDRNAIALDGNIDGATIRDNKLTGRAQSKPPERELRNNGILISNTGNDTVSAQIQIIGNTITDHRRGVSIASASAYRGQLKVEFNRIVRNQRGVHNSDPDASELIDADNNWWGCNQGPGSNLGRCDGTSENVNFDPWLVLRLRAGDPAIDTGGDSTQMTASLLTNSAGDTPVTFFPDNTRIDFETTRGKVGGRGRTADAVARSQLSSTSKSGTARVSATLDNETKRVKVDIEKGD